METNLIPGQQPLAVDGEIMRWLASITPPHTRSREARKIGIRSEAGQTYRVIHTAGTAEWLNCLIFLAKRLFLELELDEAGYPVVGFDAVFRPRRVPAARLPGRTHFAPGNDGHGDGVTVE
jgi:hypothetical protein